MSPHTSHTEGPCWYTECFFFLWAPDGEFPSMQQCLCSSHIPAALCKRGYQSGVAISSRNVAIALSAVTTLFWKSVLTPSSLDQSSIYPPSPLSLLSGPCCGPVCTHTVLHASSIFTPSALLSSINPTSSCHPPIILRHHTDTDWLNRQQCSWLAGYAAVHRRTEPDNLSGMEKFRQEDNLSKPQRGHLYIMCPRWISSPSSLHLLSISQSLVSIKTWGPRSDPWGTPTDSQAGDALPVISEYLLCLSITCSQCSTNSLTNRLFFQTGDTFLIHTWCLHPWHFEARADEHGGLICYSAAISHTDS